MIWPYLNKREEYDFGQIKAEQSGQSTWSGSAPDLDHLYLIFVQVNPTMHSSNVFWQKSCSYVNTFNFFLTIYFLNLTSNWLRNLIIIIILIVLIYILTSWQNL